MQSRANRALVAIFILVAAAGISPPRGLANVVFTEVSRQTLPVYQRETELLVTGGAAVGDCDGDGWPDIYLASQLEHALYRNRGDGTFEDLTEQSNLAFLAQQDFFNGRGAAFGDIDNDGDLDLYVTGYAQARHWLFINDGTCRFAEEAEQRGVRVDSVALGRSASFGDYNLDGYLDLFVTEVWAPTFAPRIEPPVSHLFRNRGAPAPGYFDDVTIAAGLRLDHVFGTQPGIFPFTPRFVDFDRDGLPDLAIASDFGQSRLYWNLGDGRFADGTASAGVGTDEYGMGAVTADFDGDGWLDWFVSSIYLGYGERGTGNRLYRYAGGRTFEDITDFAQVRNGMWGWGVAALDYDNDGDQDLALANGIFPGDAEQYAEREFGSIDLSPFFVDRARFWRNRGDGRFDEVAAEVGFFDRGAGQGLVAFDYDSDGDLDLLLTHDHAVPPLLFRNEGGNSKPWLQVALRGVESNRYGIGAFVTVVPASGKPQVQEVSASSTYFAQNGDAVLHFGLGDATRVDFLEIRWPSGTIQRWRQIDANQRITVVEPASCRVAEGNSCQDTPTPVVSTSTPTPIATTTLPSMTPTPTPRATPAACYGDCSQDGEVTIEEILLLVRIALEFAPAGDCQPGDADANGTVTIDEILAAVNNALFGCAGYR
ncbi:MAG: CRTAC1 family protein [candidate division KSB1 bacterium]|nr:CRTAC1 family protein [candidate division KSB1 bacterium]